MRRIENVLEMIVAKSALTDDVTPLILSEIGKYYGKALINGRERLICVSPDTIPFKCWVDLSNWFAQYRISPSKRSSWGCSIVDRFKKHCELTTDPDVLIYGVNRNPTKLGDVMKGKGFFSKNDHSCFPLVVKHWRAK